MQERRLAAVMFADIVGYTALMQSDEERALARLNKFKESVTSVVPRFDGEVIQFYGDGCLCIFRSSFDAARCAVHLQKDFIGALDVPVRVGLHAGDILLKEGHVFGDSINLTSRIESLGVPGSILCSERVVEAIKNKPGLTWKQMGSFAFKNVEHPMDIFAITNDGLVVPRPDQITGKLSTPARSGRRRLMFGGALLALVAIAVIVKVLASPRIVDKSIAVLPFVNMTPDKTLDYFGDGIMDDILTNLAQIGDIKVISRTSAMLYKNTDKSIPEVADELGVAYIVEGSVQKSSEKIKIIAQLINAKEDDHVWANNYLREVDDILDVQTEVSRDIVRSLRANIAPQLRAVIDDVPTESLDAYNLYQEALHLVKTRTQEGLEQAIDKLDQALVLDPNYDRALSEKAAATFLIANVGYADPADYYGRAEEIAHAAIAMNARSARAYGVLGGIYRERLEWKSAIDAYLTGLDYSPNDALINYWLSLALREIRAFDQAITYGEKASALDPLYPVIHMGHTVTCVYAGAHEKARNILEIKRNLFGDSFLYHWAYAILHLATEDYDKAIRSCDTALRINPGVVGIRALQGLALGGLGREDEVEDILQELPADQRRSNAYRATLYLGLGEIDSTFHYINQSNQLGMYRLEVGYAPWYQRLKDDPRYSIVLKQMRVLDTEAYLVGLEAE